MICMSLCRVGSPVIPSTGAGKVASISFVLLSIYDMMNVDGFLASEEFIWLFWLT